MTTMTTTAPKNISSLPDALKQAEYTKGDEAIKQKLDTIVKTDYRGLDRIINELSSSYSLTQIYKVYYKTFGF